MILSILGKHLYKKNLTLLILEGKIFIEGNKYFLSSKNIVKTIIM